MAQRVPIHQLTEESWTKYSLGTQSTEARVYCFRSIINELLHRQLLGSLHAELQGCAHLTSLTFRGYCQTDLQWEFLRCLPNLTHLDLRDTEISLASVLPYIVPKSLRTFLVGGLSLRGQLPNYLNCLDPANVSELIISDSSLRDGDIQAVGANWKDWAHISTLDLSLNQLQGSLQYWSEHFPPFPNITKLNIEGNNPSYYCLEGVSAELVNMTTLTSLAVAQWVEMDIKHLITSLPMLKNLTHLDVSSLVITYEQLNALLDQIACMTQLEHLVTSGLSGTRYRMHRNENQTKATNCWLNLVEKWRKFHFVSTLIADTEMFEAESHDSLQDAYISWVTVVCKIQPTTMSFRTISEDVWDFVAAQIASQTQLTSLALGASWIDSRKEVWSLLADGLANCSQLTHLKLHASLNDDFYSSFCHVLENLPLTHLSLTGQSMMTDMMQRHIPYHNPQALFDLLPRMTQLQELDVACVCYSPENIEEIRKILPQCSHLQVLKLASHKAEAHGWDNLEGLLDIFDETNVEWFEMSTSMDAGLRAKALNSLYNNRRRNATLEKLSTVQTFL